jgi:hypothetical protein
MSRKTEYVHNPCFLSANIPLIPQHYSLTLFISA